MTMIHQPLRVLLIAAPQTAAAIRHVLTSTSPQAYRILAAAGGAEGLRHWRAELPDCVMLDEHLADMPALEVLASLVQATGGNAPVVLLTSGASGAAALGALQRGAQDCLDRDHLTAFEVERAIANTVEKVGLRRAQQHAAAAFDSERLSLAIDQLDSVAVGRDITASKHTAEALRQSEEKFAKAFASSPAALLITRIADGRLIELNEAYCAIVGYARAELVGRLTTELNIYIQAGDRQAIVDQLQASGAIRNVETSIRHRSGEIRYLLANQELITLNGEICLLSNLLDITERKAAEAALRSAMEREQELRHAAETSIRLKDEFLATVSHELRTPLTAFLGYAQLVQIRKRDEAYVARTIEKMVQSARSQAQLIENLLDVSRVAGGRLRIELAPLELIPIVQAAVDTLRPTLETKDLQLQLTLDLAARRVRGDTNRLQQVVWNLLANAAKFTPTGGVIHVGLTYDERAVRLTVRDTGQGIHPDFLPFVFERFRQEDSTSKRAHGGLGLGLAIVRHLVELHGGTVEAASAGIGQGATFTVRLPLMPPVDTSVAADVDDGTRPRAGRPPALHGRRVLVVDDQPAILDVLEETLAACGAVVRRCTTAREALEALRAWRPDVLVSDIALPGNDGYWLIQQVRALPPEDGGVTPAVALTTYVRMEDRLQVLRAGFQLYVPKPIEVGELQDVVARLAWGDDGSL